MKKLFFNIFLLIGSFSLLFLVSCNDDDDVIIINEGPEINIQVNGGDIDGPHTAGLGQTIVLNLDITDDDGVDSVVVRQFVGTTQVTEATQVIYPSAVGGTTVTQNVEITLVDVDVDDEVRIEITAYDVQGNSRTETIIVNVSAIGSYTTVLLYAPLADETSESFLNTSTGQTYSVNDVMTDNNPVSAQVDLGYYYGATNNASLASPQQIHNLGIYDLSAWNTLNTTQLRRTTISETEFLENEGNVEFISGAFGTAQAEGGGQQVSNLQVGDVVAFQLSEGQGNRTGLIRVSNIEPGDGVGNFIEIDVLVSYLPGEPTDPAGPTDPTDPTDPGTGG
jgi:hypothetical protein